MMVKKRYAGAAVLIAGLSALVAAACTQDGSKGALPAAANPGFALFYMDEGASAKLAYGAPNSDDVGLMMECAKGSHTIYVSDVARGGAAPTLTLASQGRSASLAATPSSGDGAALLTARARSDIPPMQAFRRSGRIDVAYAGSKYAITASPTERAGVERFFAACDRA
jgi:hypothetical protein